MSKPQFQFNAMKAALMSNKDTAAVIQAEQEKRQAQEQAKIRAEIARLDAKAREKASYARAVAIQKLLAAKKAHKAVKPLRETIAAENRVLRFLGGK
jgi:flagellar biosynthesis regulator FlbT